jgi:hemerythrin-like domain-containing protein
MCEYCGCQDIAAIAELTAEHDVVVGLIRDARLALASGDFDEAGSRARAIAAVLAPHTAVEEGALFPAMATEFADHVAGLLEEHRLVEAVLAESAEGTPTDPSWPGRLDSAVSVLREHISKEQDGLFPAALAVLDSADWDLLDHVRADVGTAIAAVGQR